MILKLLDYLCKKNEDFGVGLIAGLGVGLSVGLSAGLVVGLIAGLGVGLIAGLGVGLSAGLIAGLSAGLIAGLSAGLVVGLIAGLITGLIAGLINNEYGLLVLPSLIIFYLLSEIVYFIEQRYFEKKHYENLWIVLLKKLEAFFDVLLIGINGLNIWWLTKNVNWIEKWNYFKPYLFTFFGYFGILILIGLGIWLILWLNWQIKPKKR